MDRTLGLTCASLLTLPPEVWRSATRQAAEQKYRSVWTAETTGAESFATLAALAEYGLDLGTGVLAAPLRTPLAAAMGAATLQALNPDRSVFMGVGVSSPAVVARWHGADYPTAPLTYMREYLAVLRSLFSGEPVLHRGDWFSFGKVSLGVRLERSPKIVLGALNPGMLRLAGELADGVLLNYLPASHVPSCVEQVREGERRAGRALGSCRIFAYVHAGCADFDRARRYAQRDLFSYAVVDGYARAFSAAGFSSEVDAIRNAHANGDRDAALDAVSDTMIQAIDHIGNESSVAAFVHSYFDAGVDTAILMPLPWDEERTVGLQRTIAAASCL